MIVFTEKTEPLNVHIIQDVPFYHVTTLNVPYSILLMVEDLMYKSHDLLKSSTVVSHFEYKRFIDTEKLNAPINVTVGTDKNGWTYKEILPENFLAYLVIMGSELHYETL